jgi:hypothetical protein
MKPWLFIVGLMAALPAFAQHQPAHDAPAPAQPPRSGYAGMQNRAIKALSEKQVADLRAGRGMMLALPAELNGYPGPSHTLELAGPLGLSEEQKQKTQAFFAQMQAEAMRLGDQVIASEHELDRLFKDRRGSIATMQEAVAKAARTQGELRAVHLRYHLLMLDVLTPAQVTKYSELRGYN